jgi:hypothetical protein
MVGDGRPLPFESLNSHTKKSSLKLGFFYFLPYKETVGAATHTMLSRFEYFNNKKAKQFAWLFYC